MKIYGELTPVNIEDINRIFDEHTDLILVTDKIKKIRLLLAQFKFPERMIVECFSTTDCLDAINLGVRYVAYNIDISNDIAVSSFINGDFKSIGIVTFNAKLMKEDTRALSNAQKLLSFGKVNFVYSSNEDSFIKKHLGTSVSAFYTDDFSISQKRCISTKCNTY